MSGIGRASLMLQDSAQIVTLHYFPKFALRLAAMANVLKVCRWSARIVLKAMQESKVTTRVQTTLPRDVRSALCLEAGDTLRYIVEGALAYVDGDLTREVA